MFQSAILSAYQIELPFLFQLVVKRVVASERRLLAVGEEKSMFMIFYQLADLRPSAETVAIAETISKEGSAVAVLFASALGPNVSWYNISTIFTPVIFTQDVPMRDGSPVLRDFIAYADAGSTTATSTVATGEHLDRGSPAGGEDDGNSVALYVTLAAVLVVCCACVMSLVCICVRRRNAPLKNALVEEDPLRAAAQGHDAPGCAWPET